MLDILKHICVQTENLNAAYVSNIVDITGEHINEQDTGRHFEKEDSCLDWGQQPRQVHENVERQKYGADTPKPQYPGPVFIVPLKEQSNCCGYISDSTLTSTPITCISLMKTIPL